jgi:hypothetical protein
MGKHPSYPKGEGLITRGTFGPTLSTVILDEGQQSNQRIANLRQMVGSNAPVRIAVGSVKRHCSRPPGCRTPMR